MPSTTRRITRRPLAAAPGSCGSVPGRSLRGRRLGRTGGGDGRPDRRGLRRAGPERVATAARAIGDLRGIEEAEHAAAEQAGELRRGRGPMAGELRRLVDDDVGQLAGGQDVARAVAAPAPIEIVAVEIEHDDARATHLLEQRVELGRVAAPAVIELGETAISF